MDRTRPDVSDTQPLPVRTPAPEATRPDPPPPDERRRPDRPGQATSYDVPPEGARRRPDRPGQAAPPGGRSQDEHTEVGRTRVDLPPGPSARSERPPIGRTPAGRGRRDPAQAAREQAGPAQADPAQVDAAQAGAAQAGAAQAGAAQAGAAQAGAAQAGAAHNGAPQADAAQNDAAQADAAQNDAAQNDAFWAHPSRDDTSGTAPWQTTPPGTGSVRGAGGRPDQVTLRFGPGVPAEVARIWRDGTGPRRPMWRRVAGGLLTTAVALLAALAVWWLLRGGGPAVRVTGVSVRVPTTVQHCDTTVGVVGTIRTNGGRGDVSYRWRRSDGQVSGVFTETLRKGRRSVRVPLRWTIKGTGTLHAVATLEVVAPRAPAGHASAGFVYTCG